MEIKIVDKEGKEVTTPLQSPIANKVSPVEGGSPLEMDEKAIGQVLGLETPSALSKYSDNLKTLLEYAKVQTQDHSPESLKWVIRSLSLKMGTPALGEDRVKFLARYAYLVNDNRRIENEMKKFEQI